ncbi:V-type proton ATPase subunit E [Oxobacter pfennigii]|uniref:V-type proton ATPase subunit E n=1 Tax=Oxobacter pfennigii TaxID=36849 RepID=A0A0P8W688_9CLOT|nr:V-type ATP synthase subunit E [Oxobacter pfennigii]KPU44207.1 V-type proton ATPase subunit E [Oxobacter pfennigii]
MAGIDNLKKRILRDDEIEAEKILKEAEDKAKQILEESKIKAESAINEAKAKAQKNGEDSKDRIIARARLDGRNNVLSAKQELIDKIFTLAEEKINSMDKKDYSVFIEELLINSVETGDEEVILSDNDKDRLDPGLVAMVNQKLTSQNKNWMLKISDEKRNIKSGFLLKNKGIEVNCSVESLIRSLRESLEGEIAGLLFEDR